MSRSSLPPHPDPVPPRNAVLLGPPGSGKSTIAEGLARRVPVVIIATGSRLRQEVQEGSPLGQQIKPLIEQGHLVPDALMSELLRHWLAQVPPDHGLLLDGYPRSRAQAHMLTAILNDLECPLDLVIALNLTAEEITRRLAGRRVCQGGDAPFTLHISDHDAVQRCHEQGGHLIQRHDDRPEVITERLRVYTETTRPLLDFYNQRGLLREVDAQGTPDEVAENVLRLFQASD